MPAITRSTLDTVGVFNRKGARRPSVGRVGQWWRCRANITAANLLREGRGEEKVSKVICSPRDESPRVSFRRPTGVLETFH